MAYSTILIHFQDPDRAEALVQAAAAVAGPDGAHVIGLYVVPRPQYFYGEAAMGMAVEVFEAEQKFFLEEAEKIRKVFERSMGGGLVGEWRRIESATSAVSYDVIAHGRCCDLIIAGQVPLDEDSTPSFAEPETLLMECGRPVLVVPSVGKYDSIGNNILVAWNGSREGARAVFDALPLLQRAKGVRLIWVNPGEEQGGGIKGVAGSELAATLARHKVNVEASRSVNTSISVADELLARASDESADLLVMGGYGHSRVREYVFGGATRGILQHMTLPVLLSH